MSEREDRGASGDPEQPGPAPTGTWHQRLWPFGLPALLSQAESALAQQNWAAAKERLVAGWGHVQSMRTQGQPDAERERWLLRGLALATFKLSEQDACVQHCRIARQLGHPDDFFYEFPCRRALQAPAPLSPDGIDDLVAWACWTGAAQSRIPAAQVSVVLERALRPRDGMPAEAHPAPAALARTPLAWVWPYRVAAELARRAGAWSAAATALQAAVEREQDPQARGRLLWQLARAWHAGETPDKAAQALAAARKLVAPVTVEDWAFLVSVLRRSDPGLGWAAALEAVKAHPEAQRLVEELTDCCALTGRWAEARGLVAPVLAAAKEAGRPAAVGFAFALARALHDEEVALTAAQAVLAGPGAFSGGDESLRVAAAVFLIARGPLATADWARLSAGLQSDDARARLETLRLWGSLRWGQGQIEAPPETPGWQNAWQALQACLRLQSLLARDDLRGLAAQLGRVGSLVPSGLASDLQKAGAWRALAGGDDDTALAIVEARPDDACRREIASGLLSRAVAAWRADNPAAEARAAVGARFVQAALRLGATLPESLRLWWPAVELLARDHDGARCAAPLAPLGEGGRPDDWGLLAYLGACRNLPGWPAWAEEACRRAPEHVLAPFFKHHLAASLVAAQRWEDAAELLGVSRSQPSAVLAYLGAEPWLCRWHKASEALARQEFLASARLALDAADEAPGVCPAGLLQVALRSLAASAESKNDEKQHLLAHITAHATRFARAPGSSTTLPWQDAARLGLWDLAERILRDHLRVQADSASLLHAYALVNLSGAAAQAGAPSGRARQLLAGMGAWTALSVRQEVLTRFISLRFDAYRRPGELAPSAALRQRMTEWLDAFCELQAQSCGLDAQWLRVLREAEQMAAEVVRDCGGVGSGEGGGIPGGPLLVAALTKQPELQAFIRKTEAEERQLELKRLFSPLAPAVAMQRSQRFAEAAEAADAVLREGAHWARSARAAAHFLESFVESAARQRSIQEEARGLVLDAHLGMARQEVAKMPLVLDAARGSLSAALAVAESIGRSEEMRAGLGEIVAGRAEALFATRNKAEREADEADRRSDGARAKDGLDLLRMAWTCLHHPSIEGAITKWFNVHAVKAAEKNRFVEATDLLLDAIAVNPRARLLCDNLAKVLAARAQSELAADAPAAADAVLEVRRKIGDRLDQLPKSEQAELFRCLDEIGNKASSPFFNASGQALEREDYEAATSLMMLAASVGPEDRDVEDGLASLRATLEERAAQGNRVAGDCLSRMGRAGTRTRASRGLDHLLAAMRRTRKPESPSDE